MNPTNKLVLNDFQFYDGNVDENLIKIDLDSTFSTDFSDTRSLSSMVHHLGQSTATKNNALPKLTEVIQGLDALLANEKTSKRAEPFVDSRIADRFLQGHIPDEETVPFLDVVPEANGDDAIFD